MKQDAYRNWLEELKYEAGTVNAQMYRAARVEQYHGDLDEHYAKDRMVSLLLALTYSAEDRRRARPNPSKIPFEGDILSNIRSYRGAVERYRRFRDVEGEDQSTLDVPGQNVAAALTEDTGQRIGLERDMQAALRKNIQQLEEGLEITDDGAERSVQSGFIDITARDAQGRTVVVELKAGLAGQRAIAQILSYMGDVATEEGGDVRGILIASDFDPKAKAAARMVPALTLRRYSVRFLFADVSV